MHKINIIMKENVTKLLKWWVWIFLMHNGQSTVFLNPGAQMYYKVYKRKLHSQVLNSHCFKVINSLVKHWVLALIRSKCTSYWKKSSPSWSTSSGLSKDLRSESCLKERGRRKEKYLFSCGKVSKVA